MLEIVPGHQNRWRTLREGEGKGPVVHWMSRDQRPEDNWAPYHAWAREGVPWGIAFCLVPDLLGPALEITVSCWKGWCRPSGPQKRREFESFY